MTTTITPRAAAAAVDGDSCGAIPHLGGWRWWAQVAGFRNGGWAHQREIAEDLAEQTWLAMLRNTARPS